jgi:RHS repeat-associated protein
VQAGGKTVATLVYKSAGTGVTKQPTQYIHADRLGSTSLVTGTDSGAGPGGTKAVVLEDRSYDAFGAVRDPDWRTGDAGYTRGVQRPAVDQGYTGHDDDRELGLVNMGGRLYDPTLARFTTPDPFVSGPHPTQAWNPYSYVSNNPLRHTDPSGFVMCAGCPENLEEFAGLSDAFWDMGAAGISPLNADGPDGGRRLELEQERYYARQDEREEEQKKAAQKQWKEEESSTVGTNDGDSASSDDPVFVSPGGSTACTRGSEPADTGAAPEPTCDGSGSTDPGSGDGEEADALAPYQGGVCADGDSSCSVDDPIAPDSSDAADGQATPAAAPEPSPGPAPFAMPWSVKDGDTIAITGGPSANLGPLGIVASGSAGAGLTFTYNPAASGKVNIGVVASWGLTVPGGGIGFSVGWNRYHGLYGSVAGRFGIVLSLGPEVAITSRRGGVTGKSGTVSGLPIGVSVSY